MAFTPLQQNWIWYQDDAAEPTASYAAEGTAPSITGNPILRLRITVRNSGTTAGNNKALSVEYSLDNTTFVAFGSANHWDYANGAASAGTTTTFKTSDATSHGVYHEDGVTTESWAASAIKESDVAIQATANALRGQTYYFRLKQAGTEIPLGSGETHPSLLTALAGTLGTLGDGTLTAALTSSALTSSALAGSVGTAALDSSVALSGSEGTVSAGSSTATDSFALTGEPATVSPGTIEVLSSDVTRPLTGEQAEGAVGTAAAQDEASLVGVDLTPSVESVLAQGSFSASGQAASADVGSLGQDRAVAQTGAQAATAIDSLEKQVEFPLSGLLSTGATGTVIAPGSAQASLSGEAATGSVNTTSPEASIATDGIGAGVSLGSLPSELLLGTDGLEAVSSFGLIQVDTGGSVQMLSGLAAVSAVGGLSATSIYWRGKLWSDTPVNGPWTETPIDEPWKETPITEREA